MDRVRIALIGERASGMVGDAAGVALGDIAQILGGQFQHRHRVAIAGPAGLCREVAEKGAVVWIVVRDSDLYQHGIGGRSVSALGCYLECQGFSRVHGRCAHRGGQSVHLGRAGDDSPLRGLLAGVRGVGGGC